MHAARTWCNLEVKVPNLDPAKVFNPHDSLRVYLIQMISRREREREREETASLLISEEYVIIIIRYSDTLQPSQV